MNIADPNSSTEPPQAVSFWQALKFWFKLGFISFGGPAGQIAIMHEELVVRRRWLSEKRFLHALNYCMVLPGPEAQQLATYIGWLMHKTRGGIAAGALFVLPSLFMLIGLSWLYIAFGHITWVTGLFFPLIVLAAAVIGFVGGRMSPASFNAGGGHADSQTSFGSALIDDHTPTPQHALFTWKRLLMVVLVGAALWLVPMSLLIVQHGWDHTLTQMSWFFTKAALLTFGGAYAVLPYVYQGAVEQFGWVTAAQMIDGLALGETTPGPLIMVVAYVGFIGGYVKAVLGPDSLFLAGALAATLVTWFTFLPSFIFILAGGPFVESTHNDLKFTAPLTAITAAVVGVILNLALFFGYHTLWPQGFAGSLDVASALIAVGAAIALFKFKRNVMHVIAVCGLLGICLQYAMK